MQITAWSKLTKLSLSWLGPAIFVLGGVGERSAVVHPNICSVIVRSSVEQLYALNYNYVKSNQNFYFHYQMVGEA